MAAIEARRDLNEKLKLERKLMQRLGALNTQIVRKTIGKYAREGLTFDASELQDDLSGILEDHYEDVAAVFDVQIRDELPNDIRATQAEDTLIEESLAVFFVARSGEQAQIITDTNQDNINSSIQAGIDTAQETEGGLSQPEQAMIAGAILSRKLRGRRQGIATTETQMAAESSKATEAEVLSGKQPSIVAASPADVQVSKEWVTVGDENVRVAHVAADSQEVDISKPFTVGGELLRFPGDTSLGASAGNVINCRCASVYDAQAIFAVRRRRAGTPAVTEPPIIETEPGEQLRESVG